MEKQKRIGAQDLSALQEGLKKGSGVLPVWVKAVVALALGLGTMIGWRRIVTTVAERIGKTHLAYAQGASAELTTMGTILLADNFGLPVSTVRPFHVAAWIEDFPGSKPTIKQKLAAVRMLYEFLVVRQITSSNPHSVRGPKYVVKKGKTPVWSREDAKTLLESIPKDSVSGLRDLALIAAMFYSLARVSAVDDYYHNGARRRLRLHEKGGKEHEMPVHHLLEQILNEYVETAGLRSGQPLFQSVNSAGTAVTGRALNLYNAWAAIRKRAKAAGFLTLVGCHTWRATGITIYLENDGRLEHAQQMAGHESPRTTKLYDRTKDELTLSEVERIRL